MLNHHQIWKRFNRHQLRKTDTFDFKFTFDNLFSSNSDVASTYYMGLYSESGIFKALKHYGIIRKLSKKGYSNIVVQINTKDPFKQRVAIYQHTKSIENLLGELVLQRKKINITPQEKPEANWSEVFLSIEWLLLQDLNHHFTIQKPRLPGQFYPGLGIGKTVLKMIYMIAWHLHLNGLLNVPEYYHNAAMYSKRFCFLDPVQQGLMAVFKRDLLSRYTLPVVTWAMEAGCITLNNQPYKWKPQPQIVPLCGDLKTYFKSPNYLTEVNQTADKHKAALNFNAFEDYLRNHPVEGLKPPSKNDKHHRR